MSWRASGLLVLLLLGGCGRLIDSDAARVCRMVIPALDRGPERIDVVRTTVTGRANSAEQVVVIDYRPAGTLRGAAMRRISCVFEAEPIGDPTDVLIGIASHLAAVVGDDGAVSGLRLHLLKRNLFGRGVAHLIDPAPYATTGVVPNVPRWLALVTQNILSALPIISIYALLAAAYALIYGLTGRINLAFGELTVLAGYGAFLGFAALGGGSAVGVGLLGAVLLALFTGVTQGAAMGRWVMAPLVGRPGQHVLIATIGLSLFWSELVRITQGSTNRWMGPLFNRPLALVRNGDFVVTVTPMALILPLIAGAAGVALLLLMARTPFGRRWRAFADDPLAAQLLGTDPHRLILLTMVIASGCAALAGMLTTFYYGGVGFAGGQLVGLKALIAAVIGGVGSLPGALLGGIVLGLAETAWSAVFQIETRDPAIFALLVALLALRPEGLLGVREDKRQAR